METKLKIDGKEGSGEAEEATEKTDDKVRRGQMARGREQKKITEGALLDSENVCVCPYVFACTRVHTCVFKHVTAPAGPD